MVRVVRQIQLGYSNRTCGMGGVVTCKANTFRL